MNMQLYLMSLQFTVNSKTYKSIKLINQSNNLLNQNSQPMGASLCGSEGTQYLCNKRHIMHYLSIQQNPQDILNESTPDNRICVICNRSVEECQARVAWGCEQCKFYYCAKCKGYKTDQCPRNHALKIKQDFKPKDDAFCDICASPIAQKALHCEKCKFNVCQLCVDAKTAKKK